MDAKRFRDRATECRALAKSASNDVDAALLEEIAAELDYEADSIERKSAASGPASGAEPPACSSDTQIPQDTSGDASR